MIESSQTMEKALEDKIIESESGSIYLEENGEIHYEISPISDLYFNINSLSDTFMLAVCYSIKSLNWVLPIISKEMSSKILSQGIIQWVNKEDSLYILTMLTKPNTPGRFAARLYNEVEYVARLKGYTTLTTHSHLPREKMEKRGWEYIGMGKKIDIPKYRKHLKT